MLVIVFWGYSFLLLSIEGKDENRVIRLEILSYFSETKHTHDFE